MEESTVLEPNGNLDWDDGRWQAGCSSPFRDYNDSSAVLGVCPSSPRHNSISTAISNVLIAFTAGPTLSLAQDAMADGLEATSRSEVTFGAMVALEKSPVVSVLVNTTARHAVPIFVNALSNSYAAGSAVITVRNAPLPVTSSVDSALDQLSAIFAVLLIIIAFSFVPGSIVVFVVKEREKERNCSEYSQAILITTQYPGMPLTDRFVIPEYQQVASTHAIPATT